MFISLSLGKRHAQVTQVTQVTQVMQMSHLLRPKSEKKSLIITPTGILQPKQRETWQQSEAHRKKTGLGKNEHTHTQLTLSATPLSPCFRPIYCMQQHQPQQVIGRIEQFRCVFVSDQMLHLWQRLDLHHLLSSLGTDGGLFKNLPGFFNCNNIVF